MNFTIVTAVTPDYEKYLKISVPTWKRKKQFANQKMILFTYGFENHQERFRNLWDDIEIISWDMKEYASQRELILSAFVLGAAKYVQSDYWCKIDGDTIFTTDEDVFTEDDFNYDISSQRWGYSYGYMIDDLRNWAKDKNLPGKCPIGDVIINRDKNFSHSRFISYICLHKTEFVRECATYCGNRLPVASHDTYLWYMVSRLPNRKLKRGFLKHKGVVQRSSMAGIQRLLTKKKTLVFTCGYGSKYFQLAEMTMHTLRKSGYSGDAIMFTDQKEKGKHCDIINITTHPDRELMSSGKYMMFHRHIGKIASDFPYDYFTCKYLPGNFVDKNKYDFILYVDSDILFHRSIDEIVEQKNIVTDYHKWNVFDNLKDLKKYLTESEIAIAKKMPSFSGAAIGVPKEHFDFYNMYQEYYLTYIREIPHDQPALNLCLFQNYNLFNPQRARRKRYWLHYWGARKQAMVARYHEIIGN
jgi:hypothetical protein